MRPVIILVLVVAASFQTAPRATASDHCREKVDRDGNVIGTVCDIAGETRSAANPKVKTVATGDSSPAAPPPPQDIGIRTDFDRTPEGEQCVKLVDFVGPNEANSSATREAEQRFLSLGGSMPQCPGPDGLPATASTPLIEAARFWQTMPLPDLVPRIQPGKALVGWKAFLETGGEPSVTRSGATPFGDLAITATRTVTVDWDDGAGSVTGPHEGSGGPHPEGDITWVYGRSGPRDIAVTQTWTATWSIGAAGGTFSGRGTTSTLFGFPVEEVQAVRGR